MTLGWVQIMVDGEPAVVRVCYVRAWDDPAWRKTNGIPPKVRGGGRKAVLDKARAPGVNS